MTCTIALKGIRDGGIEMQQNSPRPYFHFMSKATLEKATNSLAGIIEGIVIDAKINDRELDFLHTWLSDHQRFRHRHPLNELVPIVEDSLRDGVITEEEHSDILWLCDKLSDMTYFDAVTIDIQKLHGIMAGIASDRNITEKELTGLSEWLSKHEHLKRCWPFDEVEAVITVVMANKHIDEEEHRILQEFFNDFVQICDDKVVKRPLLLSKESTLHGICAVCPEITIKDSLFCFTGASSRYQRSEFGTIIKGLGGLVQNHVNADLDYLVIGSNGNPCWAYACYGRKVEMAVHLRKQGNMITIVHETDLLDKLADIL